VCIIELAGSTMDRKAGSALKGFVTAFPDLLTTLQPYGQTYLRLDLCCTRSWLRKSHIRSTRMKK